MQGVYPRARIVLNLASIMMQSFFAISLYALRMCTQYTSVLTRPQLFQWMVQSFRCLWAYKRLLVRSAEQTAHPIVHIKVTYKYIDRRRQLPRSMGEGKNLPNGTAIVPISENQEVSLAFNNTSN